VRQRLSAATTEALIVLSVLTVAFAAAIAGITIWLVNYDGSAEAAPEPPAETQPADTGTTPPATTEAGTEGGTTEAGTTEAGTTEEATTGAGTEGEEGQGDAAAGEAVYASAGCGSCHTLAAAGSTGNVGPNLDDASPSFDKVVEIVTEGAPPMPAFGNDGLLDPQQIQDVAAYVSQSTAD
jgi:mono/diheme cytochrome c family protein